MASFHHLIFPLVYTRHPQEAKEWDFNFKLVSSEGNIFYTARALLQPFNYFQALLTSGLKESQNNSLQLNLSTAKLEKYLGLIFTNGEVDLTNDEIVEFFELADYHGLDHVIERLTKVAVTKQLISAINFLYFLRTYHLDVEKIPGIPNLFGIREALADFNAEEVVIIFRSTCHHFIQAKTRHDPLHQAKDYSKTILACYDRLTNLGVSTKDVIEVFDHPEGFDEETRWRIHYELIDHGLYSDDDLIEYRLSLVAFLDFIVSL